MKLTFALLIACLLAAPASASSISDERYAQTMQEIDALQARMIETIAALDKGMSPAEAAKLKPEFDERLDWLRRTKVAASQIGVNNAHTKLKSARYPLCIVLRTGELDPFLQDLTVNLALSVSQMKLLTIDIKKLSELRIQNDCLLISRK